LNTGGPNPSQNGTGYAYAQSLSLGNQQNRTFFVPYTITGNSGSLCWQGVFNGVLTPMVTTRDTRNTTVDSNGFIKVASPVVKIYGDGNYKTNDESEGVTVTRLDVGQYLIDGVKHSIQTLPGAVLTEVLRFLLTGISNRSYGWIMRLTPTALCW
jgi:hypothetical protein